MSVRLLAALTVLVCAIGVAAGDPAPGAPPAQLLEGKPQRGAALEPVFAHLKLDRLRCTFREDKRVALLARPLHSTGKIYFQRDKGIARITLTPKRQDAVLTASSLRIRTGQKLEEIPLDKTVDLKAFALIFPTLLRGDRAELERSFAVELYGSDRDWWALSFTPNKESLRALVSRVVVFGKASGLVALRVVEASGDTTETALAEIATNKDVPDAELAEAFAMGARGAP